MKIGGKNNEKIAKNYERIFLIKKRIVIKQVVSITRNNSDLKRQ